MADPKLVGYLKQGSSVWNDWRLQYIAMRYDVEEIREICDLSEANLSGLDLSRANLRAVNLNKADLSKANLEGTYLVQAILSGANLTEAQLGTTIGRGAPNWSYANLRRAYLDEANLSKAKLMGAILIEANLQGADLSGADLSGADLSGADFTETKVRDTIFARTNLNNVRGLAEIVHSGSSLIELYTVRLPQDGSALHFLRGAGVPDAWIAVYQAEMMHPIQYHSCFIAYSSKDERLAQRLHADLQDHGVRCWFAPHDMKIGDKIRPRIDEAIHLQDKLLLLLSEHSIASDWVADEVEAAIEKEQRQKRGVLFPVRLDDAVIQTTQAWVAKLRRSTNIGDFTNWPELQAYQVAFARLLDNLKKS